jgi:signal transduction histidine kinase
MVGVNTTLAQSLGYSRVELQGWHFQKILAPGGRVFYNTHVFPLLRMHGVAEEIYLPLRTRDGTDIPMLLNARRHTEGSSDVSDCVFVRMLQRHKYEDELLQSRRMAEEASASKGRFLSMMSHELRTPLTAIRGYAQLIATSPDASVTATEFADIIRVAALDLERLIEDILGYAQMDAGRVPVRIGVVPISEALARAEALVRVKMRDAGVALDVGPAEGVVAAVDGDRLQQVLLNLLVNAAKFTPPGGSVTVRTGQRDGRVRITVSDTGIGVPADQIENIFEPFVQLSASVPEGSRGVGLGLAISRDLVRRMNGDLTASSESGKGTTFTIELPAATAHVPV